MLDKNAKVLQITILDGDGSESGELMKAISDTGLNQSYFVFVTVKPFQFATRADFAAAIDHAMKGLRNELPKPPPVAPEE